MRKSLASLTAMVTVLLVAGMAFAADKIIDPADSWDHLWKEILIDLFVMGAVFGLLGAYWLVKYKAKSPDQVGDGPTLSRAQMWSWALVPVFIFMADDFFLAAKGWTAWNTYRNVPENAMEIKVTGSMWSWQFEYENGVTTDYYPEATEDGRFTGDGEGLVVPVGRPIVLRMTSTDVVHSFGLTKYRVKEDLMPGRITYLWFYPKEEADSWVTCTEFCGTLHAYMFAPVKAVPQEKFDQWLTKQQTNG